MKFVSVDEAIKRKKGRVSLRGWVYRERGSKKVKFIILRDSTGIIQCVLEREKFEDQWNEIDKVQIETSVKIEGELIEEKRAVTGVELKADKFEIVGKSEDFPINKDLNEKLLGDRRHLWLRSRKMNAILKIRDSVLEAMRSHWRKKGFYEYHSPTLIGIQCEGGASLFKVDYFGKKMFLSQTWQLHAEPGIFSLEKIFTIQPAFRAEKSKTSRHLTEFWMAEMEVAWEGFDYLQNDAEELIKDVIKHVLKKNKKELELLKRDIKKLERVVEKKFKRITYDEALEILKKKGVEVKWGKDLRTIEEDVLSRDSETPIIVTLYPKEVKAFYMKEGGEGKDGKVVLGFDMIAPEGYGEIVGGSEREESIEKLKENLKEDGENPEDYNFYFDTRRYGSVPHGGYGVGVERVIAWICGLDTIKDAIAFPRTMTRYIP